MYKLLLVSDKEEIRSLYRHYAEWNTLGFEQPAIAENAQRASICLVTIAMTQFLPCSA